MSKANIDFRMNVYDSCVLCEQRLMGPPVMLTVYPETPDQEDLPFCSDSMGCRRRAFKLLRSLHASHESKSNS